MSYILEALRKSEQERNADKVPDLTTSHTHIHKEKKHHYFWWIIGTVFVMINGLFLFYKMNEDSVSTELATVAVIEDPQEITEDIPVTDRVSEKPQAENMSNAIQPEINLYTDTNRNESSVTDKNKSSDTNRNESFDTNHSSTEQQVQLAEIKPVEQKPSLIDSSMIPDINALSYSIQQQLPEMEYTTHIHVKEGGSFIIINGRSFGEGQQITQGLTIEQIQSDGIILDFKGRRFFMPA
ncbi:MAG: general secretion pathway protein GspB, partial [Gammaproteobacteria bacterium]|nr:general secretion pathway protein GspB [Gammaproteobacteria bacterium]